MTAHYSDETLMAFADGMLDEPLFSAVAEAVDRDPALSARLEQLVDGAALARQGFAPLLQPVPPELEASVKAMITRQERKRSAATRWNWAWLFPLVGATAAVAAVVVVLPALQTPATGILGGLDQSQLQAALDTVPSGADYALTDGRQLHAVATFTDQSGILCREFELPGYAMVACREATQWQVTMAVATGQGDDGYRTASSLAVLDTYLAEIGASAPILDADEMQALTQR